MARELYWRNELGVLFGSKCGKGSENRNRDHQNQQSHSYCRQEIYCTIFATIFYVQCSVWSSFPLYPTSLSLPSIVPTVKNPRISADATPILANCCLFTFLTAPSTPRKETPLVRDLVVSAKF